jgi:hypothetical protein
MKTENLKQGTYPLMTLQWIALVLSTAVMAATAVRFQAQAHSMDEVLTLPIFTVLCIMGMIISGEIPQIMRFLNWMALLMSIWIANKLPFDFLTMAGLIGNPVTHQPVPVDWPGFVARALALIAAIFLGRMALALPIDVVRRRPASFYGYVAFILALPYPVFRILWAFGAAPGLYKAGAGGEGFSPLLLAIPWVLAAILSLMLITPKKWKPRRLILFAGWTASAIVSTIGPAGFWALVNNQTVAGPGAPAMAMWVFYLFYGSWSLFAIAIAAATRSYQIRSVIKPGITFDVEKLSII